jgi:general secretion pathway protein C
MRRYLTIINYLLITYAVYFSVDAFYKTAAARLQIAQPQVVAEERSAAQDGEAVRPLSYYHPINERNLFSLKADEPQKKEAKLDVEELKQTDLQLKLWGTVIGDEGDSYAVIEDAKERSQNLYKIDDQVQNAVIKEIHREKVVLMVNGDYEILEMEKMESGPAVRTASSRPRAVQRGAEHEAAPASSNIALKREKIQAAVGNLNELMKQVRIRPHFKDGQPDGLTLSGVRSGSIFSEMGLRNGDVIIGVDGQKIESVDDALGLYQNLQSANNVQVQIRRRGRLQNIDYQVE